MARIRTIKPEFFTSEDIVSLSPMARLLYIALWCEADRDGRMSWKPKTFKMRYLPGDSCNIEKLCDELTSSSLVIKYGEGYAFIPAFASHQHINPRETPSQLPEPEIDACATRAPRVSDAHMRVSDAHMRDSDTQGGREGKGKKIDAPYGVNDSVWQDFKKVRNAKKSPITQTSLEGIQREASKAGYTLEQALKTCCERGWIGFKADWVTDKPATQDQWAGAV